MGGGWVAYVVEADGALEEGGEVGGGGPSPPFGGGGGGGWEASGGGRGLDHCGGRDAHPPPPQLLHPLQSSQGQLPLQ